jgi:hypothetical protein
MGLTRRRWDTLASAYAGRRRRLRAHLRPRIMYPFVRGVHGYEVAVAPYARVRVVVCLEELTPARVVAPEAYGDRRVRPRADELAWDAGF